MIYLGFGILLTNKGIYILVAEKDDDYVTLKPLALFNIIEYSISDFWVFYSVIVLIQKIFKYINYKHLGNGVKMNVFMKN